MAYTLFEARSSSTDLLLTVAVRHWPSSMANIERSAYALKNEGAKTSEGKSAAILPSLDVFSFVEIKEHPYLNCID